MTSENPESKTKRRAMWRLWVKMLGPKASECEREADAVALARTILFLVGIPYATLGLIANLCIVARYLKDFHEF